jgi:F-type H+-transporting ATPase subunit epsilon
MAETHNDAGGKKLRLEIVTPTGRAGQGAADEVTAPGVLGEFGVLPGHVPFLSALKAGVLTWRDGGHRHTLAVDKGYLEVGDVDKVVIMVEKAATPDSIDVEEARQAIARHSEALKVGGMDPAQTEITRLQLAWAQARVDAAERAHGKATEKH